MTLNFSKKCVQCRNMTLRRCVNCFEPLCGICKTKIQRGVPGTETYLPVGVCKSCLNNWDDKMKAKGFDIAKKLSEKYMDFINKIS